MSENAWQIPSDWDGENMACVRVMWPDSEDWRRMLVSLLYTLTRGREWDAGTGIITDAQETGWKIWDANVPLRSCETGEIIAPPATIEYRGGSLIVISEDDMGQVVTDAYIDSATGELVVEFGPCCVKRFSLNVTAGDTFGDLPDEPDYPPETPEYTACAKAAAIWAVWVGIVDTLLDSAEGLAAPWVVYSALSAQFPGVKLGKVPIMTAYTAAVSVAAQGFASETETPSWLQNVLCGWANISGDDGVGWTAANYSAALAYVELIANRYFTPTAFPTAFGNMASVWFFAAQAIGEGDARDLTTRVVPTGLEDCACPGVEVVWPTLDDATANGYYIGDVIEASFVSVVDNGETNLIRHEWVAGHDIYGFVFDSFHNNTPNDGQGTLKRMALTSGSGALSWFGNTSDHLEDAGSGKWAFAKAAVAMEVNDGNYAEIVPDPGTPEAPNIEAGDDVAWEISWGMGSGGEHTVTFTNLRPIYNLNSPSHSV
jgi:hypothetical protein